MSIVAIDVETTGFGHAGRVARPDAVIQVGMAWRDEKGDVQRWSSYCNPGTHFLENGRAESALKVNGISEQTVLAALPAEKVAASFWDTVFGLDAKGDPVEFRAFNRAFDSVFLSAEPWRIPAQRWGACIMLDAQARLQSYKWPKLDEAVVRLGLAWPDGPAHDAAVDAHAALLVHEKISGENVHAASRS
ncbi:MAG: exonuclease domain-containing protein [Candidatus Micrarchaeota archaeon]|nr:exonuclease domain-containing protein [Candidatus Micrarchaeota archaeon]